MWLSLRDRQISDWDLGWIDSFLTHTMCSHLCAFYHFVRLVSTNGMHAIFMYRLQIDENLNDLHVRFFAGPTHTLLPI